MPIIRRGAPSVEDSHRLGSYFPTVIAGKRVLCFKSELHMSQDGPKLPIAKLWAQLIAEVETEAGDHHGNGRRHRAGDRAGRRGRRTLGPVRLHDQVQERALPQQCLSLLKLEDHFFPGGPAALQGERLTLAVGRADRPRSSLIPSRA